jgi:transcriptional regulator with XRE-family HTH domain
MGDGQAREDWAGYLRRMTSRPGWSVARLARESNIHRGTIFKWISGKGGVNVSSVTAIAQALGDDPANALRAAGAVAPEVDRTDEEIELVRTDPRLDPEMKIRIVDMIIDRREREREAALAETRRLIELMRGREVG